MPDLLMSRRLVASVKDYLLQAVTASWVLVSLDSPWHPRPKKKAEMVRAEGRHHVEMPLGS